MCTLLSLIDSLYLKFNSLFGKWTSVANISSALKYLVSFFKDLVEVVHSKINAVRTLMFSEL